MKRKYFSFERGVESPEIEAAYDAMDSSYICMNDDDDGAFEDVYFCDASIETPESLVPFMYYSTKSDEILDARIERRKEEIGRKKEIEVSRPKKASFFFEYRKMEEMHKFIQGLEVNLSEISIKTTENGCTLSYPAVHPFSVVKEETGWTDEDGPTYSLVTYDANGGIVNVEPKW